MQTETTENEKIFDLKKAVDPNMLLAIRTRELACDDPNLSDGAVRLFVRLLDLSLNPGLNGGKKGELVYSQMALASHIGCDERSIRRRATELIACNYVWTSLRPGINTKPITVWHITVFSPKRQVEQSLPGQGVFGNGRRRHDHGFDKTGMQATGRQRRVGSGLVDHRGQPIFLNFLDNAAGSGQKQPFTPDKIDRSQRTLASSGRGHLRPLTEDAGVLSQRSELSAGSGQNCPVTPGAGVRLKESPLEVKSPSESEIEVISSSTAERVSGSAASRKGKPGERDWLERLGRIVGPKELANWGGRWRNRYREDADKAVRVLAELTQMQREGAIHSNPGACADHLWKQFASRKAVGK